MRKRFGVAIATAATAALSLTAGALGGATSLTVPVSFQISSEFCSQLASGTTITGTGTATATIDAKGQIHTLVTGTATDNLGGSYRFNYHQSLLPRNGGEISQVTDHFNLVGDGQNVKLHSHFVAIIDGTDLETATMFALKQLHGDPFGCDPI
jgi:hypothetical protein